MSEFIWGLATQAHKVISYFSLQILLVMVDILTSTGIVLNLKNTTHTSSSENYRIYAKYRRLIQSNSAFASAIFTAGDLLSFILIFFPCHDSALLHA